MKQLKTSPIKFLYFLETSDGIFRISEQSGMLFAEMYDKSSKSFRKVADVGGILEEGIEIIPPNEIAAATSSK